ncbi:MAG: hypothetical protein JJV98_05755, partial [Desulfosarcina sp.]|nr:hypothetical protein [Desulfobacterales bacterium]
MSAYREEQMHAQKMVARYLTQAREDERQQWRQMCAGYRAFREKIARFQSRHLQAICTRSCFQSHLSACCNKDGIITFFADVVINALFSPPEMLSDLIACLPEAREDMKCIYLSEGGCRWHLKPIVCETFLCDRAQETIQALDARAATAWQALKAEAKLYRWPDRPVLFDAIESRFLAAGLCSPLMYLHNSPGLVRIKRKAG